MCEVEARYSPAFAACAPEIQLSDILLGNGARTHKLVEDTI